MWSKKKIPCLVIILFSLSILVPDNKKELTQKFKRIFSMTVFSMKSSTRNLSRLCRTDDISNKDYMYAILTESWHNIFSIGCDNDNNCATVFEQSSSFTLSLMLLTIGSNFKAVS